MNKSLRVCALTGCVLLCWLFVGRLPSASAVDVDDDAAEAWEPIPEIVPIPEKAAAPPGQILESNPVIADGLPLPGYAADHDVSNGYVSKRCVSKPRARKRCLFDCCMADRCERKSCCSNGCGSRGCDSNSCVSNGCVSHDCAANCSIYPGLFAGIGGSYNSVKLDQTFGGVGNTRIFSEDRLVATGTAGGPAPPFHNTQNTFAPLAQLGFVRDSGFRGWNWGAKISYKYLGVTFTNQNVDAPQSGSYTTTTNPPTTTDFTGNATALSAQTTVNHQLAVMSFIGHDFSRGRFYLGGGPVVFETQQRFYDLSSHADINGVTTNIGGAPLDLSHNSWMWGGAWQAGVMYYLRPHCFLDVSYDFMVTGFYTNGFSIPVTSQSGSTTYVTQLNYNITQRIWAQSLNCTLNFVF